MTSGGAGAAASEAAVSLSWRTRPGPPECLSGACRSLAIPTLHRRGLPHLSCSRWPAGELPGPGSCGCIVGI